MLKPCKRQTCYGFIERYSQLAFQPKYKMAGVDFATPAILLLSELAIGFGLLLGFRFGLCRIKFGVLAPESVDATGGVDQLLSAGEKRMTG
jgi:hypothetical protein